MYKRLIYNEIKKRMDEPRRFIQVLSGPRQTGKTTLAQQMLKSLDWPGHYATADEPALKGPDWIEQQWEVVRTRLKTDTKARIGILVLDEIQKLPGWSETVKRLWDEDTFSELPLHVFILGSSPLLVQKGLSESLAGRFEMNHITHWSYAEMQAAFGFGMDEYIYYGGYPGSAALIGDRARWAGYIVDSLIETTISRDILLMTRVHKPALLRRLFELGCSYSGQILSYQKMIGQLQDVGNTTTLAHYLNLLQGAGLLVGLAKYAGEKVRQRASSPKLLVLNTGLMTATAYGSLQDTRNNPKLWGRLVETAVGASLFNSVIGKNIDLFYWAGRNRELDFVLSRGNELIAIEVKTTAHKTRLPGIAEFSKQFPAAKKLLVGNQGITLEEFLLTPVEALF
ncbi:MAG: ATP-binding protein [Desulfobacterales bacterium]